MTGERRNALVSTALVGTVVVVLGFGAGLGALFGGGSPTSAAATPSTGPDSAPGSGAASGASRTATNTGSGDTTGSSMAMDTAAGAIPAGGTATTASPGRGSIDASSGGTAAPSASSSAPASEPSSPGPSAAASGPSGSAMGPMPSGSNKPSGCTNEVVLNAMLDPFVNHMYRAHLERSPGQQANDLLNVNQYVLTHTVLIEDMVAPAVAAVQAALNGIVPFTNHMYRAHLERSPGQQVNDALNVNQYVQTHTVLAEDMTAPAVQSVEGSYGC